MGKISKNDKIFIENLKKDKMGSEKIFNE